ncbi:hypothetical protein NDU88_005490 [Pleurodeles waltl]|uniref:Uncharacterized protein n=1 Tax=Pleurodeles waltl TaxID=8319 RepID=A0AAV7WBY8_PLEWA|nr:hypothetical protein NDU88_005490 [Pleurodeles waltl]
MQLDPVTGTSTHGLPRQCRPNSREENDAAPAVRKKIPRTAHRNDAQPDNKPRIPRTDPWASENPATHRGDLTVCRKLTQVFPAPGSSVSDQGLTTEEREFQLQMARLKIEAQQEEKRAEREAKQAEAAAERALAEKKLLLAHELRLKELDLKGR